MTKCDLCSDVTKLQVQGTMRLCDDCLYFVQEGIEAQLAEIHGVKIRKMTKDLAYG